MRVIAFASRRGGVGKTTLVGHQAVEAERRGAGPVALIDTDPQGSLAAWWNQRAAQAPLFVGVDIRRLDQQLDELRNHGVKLVMIDTPPTVDHIEKVIMLSGLGVSAGSTQSARPAFDRGDGRFDRGRE